jgi:outer membrane protein OmpA-like peptidoglycan-associated protein
MKKKFLFIFVFFVNFYVFSQESVLRYYGNRNYNFVERSDLRKYENGRYVGLVSKEVSAFIMPVFDGENYIYEGHFFVNQETVKSMQKVGFEINDFVPSKFIIHDDGTFKMLEDNGYPTFRSFPTYPKEKVSVGQSWTAKAFRSIDPLEKGILTTIPIYVQYTFKGEQNYKGHEVYCVSAMWATRYAMGTSYYDFDGDRELVKASGSHKANILIDKHTGITLVINDSVDEKFVYTDGKEVAFKGTISMFTEYPPTYEIEKLLPTIQRVAKLSDDETNKLKEESLEDNFKGEFAKKSENQKVASIQNDNKSFNEDETVDKIKKNIEKKEKIKSKNGEKVDSETNIEVENTAAGIKLTIPNLQFEPDSAMLVKGEYSRIDDIYEILKMVPQAQILIEGHTAKTGNDKGEMNLSVERAKSIAQELVKRGIKEGRLICKGSGSTKPIADNSTAEGKKINRRVEITILK